MRQNSPQFLFDILNEPFIERSCKFCKTEVNYSVYFYCAQCSILICQICFANGCQLEDLLDQEEIEVEHLNSHNYYVIGKLDFPIFEYGWDASQEIKLIEGLNKFGFGDWEAIAEEIGLDSSQYHLVKEHYEKYYISKLNSNGSQNQLNLSQYLPVFLISSQQLQQIDVAILTQLNENLEKIFDRKLHQQEKIKYDSSKSFEQFQNKELANKNLPKRKVKDHSNQECGQFSEVLGFYPYRKDFDIEYLNNAELMLADMEFNGSNIQFQGYKKKIDNDSEEDLKIKQEILKNYNIKLEERKKRTEFIITNGVLSIFHYFFVESVIKGLCSNENHEEQSDIEKQIRNSLQKYQQFLSNEEYKQFVELLLKESKIKSFIDQIKAFSNQHFQTLEEIEDYLKKNSSESLTHYQNLEKEVNTMVDEVEVIQYFQQYNKYKKTTELGTIMQNIQMNDKNNQQKQAVIGQKQLKIDSFFKKLPLLSQEEINFCQNQELQTQDYINIKQELIEKSIEKQYIKKLYDKTQEYQIGKSFNNIFLKYYRYEEESRNP